MQKIKKLALSAFVGTCAVVVTPLAQADSVDNLVNIVEESTNQTYMQAETSAVLSLDENELVLDSSFIKNGDRITEEVDAALTVKANTLPEEILDELDGLSSDFVMNVDAEAAVYYDKENGDIFYEIEDYKLDLTTTDEDTRKIIEGFFEITKIFTGETYYFNMKELKEEFLSMHDDIDELDSMMFQEITEEDFALILKFILKSGFFEVDTNGDVYTITVKDEVEEINRQAMIEILKEMEFLPLYMREGMIQELGRAITEEDYKELNEGLDKVEDYYDFKVYITVSGGVVRNLEIDFSLDLQKIFAEVGEEVEIGDLEYTQTTTFEYVKKTFAFPKEGSDEISFNKIMGMFLTFEKKMNEKWESYEGDEDWGTSESIDGPDFIELERMAKEKELKAVSEKFGDAWFVSYAEDLIEKDVIDTFQDPLRKTSENEFRSLLDKSIYSLDDYYNYDLDFDIWDSLSSYEHISKLDSVTYIVQTFFPEESNPIAFAREKGIVSNSFSVAKAREQDLILVDLVKMLSVVLEIVDSK